MKLKSASAAFLLFVFSGANAQDSGFLTDYTVLTASNDFGFARAYIAPGALDQIARFNKVMVDQPSIIIAADSKYRGAKPQDLAEVSAALREAMSDGISESFPVVNDPGEGVTLMNWAVTNVFLKKAKRGVLSFTPVGAVAYGAKSLASDAIDKTRAYDVVFEIEGTDSNTGEVFFAGVIALGEANDEVQFEHALVLANGIGKRVGCRLNNSRLAAPDREDCTTIALK